MTSSQRQWMVSARTRGELLAASVRVEGIELVLVAPGASDRVEDAEGWLRDLIGMASETAGQAAEGQPIPPILHHLLTGLLFSHAEMWNRLGEAAPFSMAFVADDREIGFGWVGSARPDLWIDDRRTEVEWVRIRDHEGREAFALQVDARHRVRVHAGVEFELSAGVAPASVDAVWVPEHPLEPGEAPAMSGPSAIARAVAGAEPPEPAPIPRAAAPEPTPLHAMPAIEASASPAPEIPVAVEGAAPLAPGESAATPRDWQVVYEGDEPPAPARPTVERRKREGLWSRILSWIGGDTGRPGHRARESAITAPARPVATIEGGASPPATTEAPALAPPASGIGEESAAIASGAPVLPDIIPPTPEPPSLAAASAAPGPSPDADDLLAELAASSLHPLEPKRSGEFMLPPDDLTPSGPDWLSGIRPDADLRVENAELSQPPARPGGPPPLPPSRLPSSAARPAPSPARPPVSQAVATPTARAPGAPASASTASAAPIAPPRSAPRPAAAPEPVAAMPQAPAPAPVAPRPAPAAPVAPAAATARVAPPAPRRAAPAPAVVPPAAPAHEVPAAHEPSWIEPAPDMVAAESAPSGPRERAPMRPRWPVPDFESAPSPWWSRPWVWAVFVAVLFAGGWLLGGMSNDREPGESSGLSRALRAIGLGGARYDVAVTSRPVGAWIAVDGKDLARRTPAAIELPPGKHQVTLSFSDLGGANFEVQGVRGDRVSLDGALWGSLVVYAGDSGIPVAVAVDGVDRGLAPVTVDSLMPGAHDIRFSGPGLSPWGQTAQIRVREEAQLVARPITSPATGVIEVHASWTDAEGSEELNGATVYLDGERRGVTPLTLELPRGPHSVRVESRGESAPVQVIDLPGGNQRFANFELGLGNDRPSMQLVGGPPKVGLDEPTTVSAVVQGLTSTEVREMWLHVRQPDGTWRRYQMMMMKASSGVVGVAVFPNTLLDSHGQTLFYCSATSQMGDDSFTEIQAAVEVPAKK